MLCLLIHGILQHAGLLLLVPVELSLLLLLGLEEFLLGKSLLGGEGAAGVVTSCLLLGGAVIASS